jgi:3-hydroxyacyl-[acyl-carrier-protein] dehydratase
MHSNDITRLLPHRPPLRLIDEILQIQPGHILAAYTVGGDFTAAPVGDGTRGAVMPRSLVLESFGQCAALLWLDGAGRAVGDQEVLMFAAGRRIRFLRDAEEGDRLVHHAALDKIVGTTAFASGFTQVDGNTIAEFGSIIAVLRSWNSLSEAPNNIGTSAVALARKETQDDCCRTISR